jgi:hypothetical protein
MPCRSCVVFAGDRQVNLTLTLAFVLHLTIHPIHRVGRLTVFFRENNFLDAVEAAVVRKKRKAAKMKAKARAQSKKMDAVDVALHTTLATTCADLNCEIASFATSKLALRTYLQDQYKSRVLLRNGMYNTIPNDSEFCMKNKPYKLRMNPHPTSGKKSNADGDIAYLTRLLHVMIAEDLQRPLEPTVCAQDTQLVRRLPVILVQYLNPESSRLKNLQEDTVAAMAQPQDNPWYARLAGAYLGKILLDQKAYYRVFAIQYVPNKGENVSHAGKQRLNPCTKMTPGIMLYTLVTSLQPAMALQNYLNQLR